MGEAQERLFLVVNCCCCYIVEAGSIQASLEVAFEYLWDNIVLRDKAYSFQCCLTASLFRGLLFTPVVVMEAKTTPEHSHAPSDLLLHNSPTGAEPA